MRCAPNALTEPIVDQLQRLDSAWRDALEASDTCQQALARVNLLLAQQLESGVEIYPHDVFRALHRVHPERVQVVILGQDPYHGPNQAQGLAFSVPNEVRTPPSLRNIFKQLALDFPDHPPRRDNDLSDWAEQGVLLLNTALTVQAGKAGSHARQGWEAVTDAIIQRVASAPQAKVFLLWGAHAQSKRSLIDAHQGGPVLVLASNHPSPLSAQRPPIPFIGCGHFRLANEWLQQHGQPGVRWIPDDPQRTLLPD